MRNKILSSIKTGAICDVLGYRVEFTKNPMVEIPEELLFTDDTQMTLFVMESLTKGNGALIRSASFGMASENPEVAFKEAFDHSFLTHDHFLSAISCGAFAMIICNMLYRGFTLKEAVDNTINYLDIFDSNDYIEVRNILYATLHLKYNSATDPVGYFGEGWVAEEALGIAVYSALLYEKTVDFEMAIKYAIYHKGDSDSTGSIFGNLVGLMIGDVEKVDELLKNTFNISIHHIYCEDIIDKVVDDFCKNVCYF